MNLFIIRGIYSPNLLESIDRITNLNKVIYSNDGSKVYYLSHEDALNSCENSISYVFEKTQFCFFVSVNIGFQKLTPIV